jgi:hypothetical protein
MGDLSQANRERQMALANEDEARQGALARIQAARPIWWRSLLHIHKYQVTDGTIAIFDADKNCEDANHTRLRKALSTLRNAPPEYESLFEDAIINATNRGDSAGARDEVRRHLPVILTSALVGE